MISFPTACLIGFIALAFGGGIGFAAGWVVGVVPASVRRVVLDLLGH